jgi:hypothetical protein
MGRMGGWVDVGPEVHTPRMYGSGHALQYEIRYLEK